MSLKDPDPRISSELTRWRHEVANRQPSLASGSSVTLIPQRGRSVISASEFHPMARNQSQAVALRDGSEDKLGLGQREVTANTQARSAAEREIGEARPALGALAG